METKIQPASDLLDRYHRWRGIAEPGFWLVFLCLQSAINSWTVWLDLTRIGKNVEFWEPAVWEWSSNMVILALVPAIIAFERRFPLRWDLVRHNLRWHLIATLVFSLVHVGGMVGLRKLAYMSQGIQYVFLDSWLELLYEYLKDARGYVLILLCVSFYRLLLLRWQGEASLLAAPDIGPPVEPLELPERFLVRKLGKEYLLPAAEIEWIQAWGNYVNLHVRGHDYPMRGTMASIEQRLDPKRFVRIHRSYIANLDFISELEILDSGDARAQLRDGHFIPVSRRYRDELRRAAEAP